MASSLSVLLFTLSSLSTLSAAYSWNFASPPQQCANLSVSVVGSGGVPPYRILVLPFGPTPLSNNFEVRKILDVPFPDNATTVSFQLDYPANSQLVAVVSDNTGFGSGGTSVAALVTTSSDTSCFNASSQTSPDFDFSIDPPNQIVECQDTRIEWNVNNSSSQPQGTPNFLGVIPGGQSFAIPESNITNITAEGTGFFWLPSIRAGTTLILVGGDDRGNGTGGSTTSLVGFGTQSNISCITGNSPSSTAGNPAGGTYPTGVSGGTTGGGSSGGTTNAGAIAGGVVGGVALTLICVILFWALRRRQTRRQKLSTSIIDADDDDDVPRAMRQNELPQNYQPEPFMIPIPTSTPSEFDDELSYGRPLSAGTRTSFYTRSETPDMASTLGGLGAGVVASGGGGSSGGRKGGVPKPMRAINIIQHQDAGPNSGEREEPVETIELPPAYTMVRTSTGGGTSSGGGAGSDDPSTSTSN